MLKVKEGLNQKRLQTSALKHFNEHTQHAAT